MAQVNTTATLDGLFKRVYGEDILRLQPDSAIIQKLVKFRESEKIGKSYEVPVILSSEQGATGSVTVRSAESTGNQNSGDVDVSTGSAQKGTAGSVEVFAGSATGRGAQVGDANC